MGCYREPYRSVIVTQSKRWPKNCEKYRVDSLVDAQEIFELAERTKQAIKEDRRLVAITLIAEIQILAQKVELAMLKAKGEP